MPNRTPDHPRQPGGHRRGGGLFTGDGPMPRESITALGWALTATIWLLAGLMMLSAIAGEAAATYPASGGRTLLWIAAGAGALNLLTAGLVAYLRRGR